MRWYAGSATRARATRRRPSRPAGRTSPGSPRSSGSKSSTAPSRPLVPSVTRRALIPPLFCWMKTWNAKADDVERRWYVVDAGGQTLGRLATRIAAALGGRGRGTYPPNVDWGDLFVVVNANKIAGRGKKLDEKRYYRHSGYPG